MDQKITVKIGEREYVLKAPTPESEELIRLAAVTVNRRLNSYMTNYAGKTQTDLLSFVALNECISRLQTERRMEALTDETAKLKADMDSYLDNIDRN